MDTTTYDDAKVNVAAEYLQCTPFYSGMVADENNSISEEMVETP